MNNVNHIISNCNKIEANYVQSSFGQTGLVSQFISLTLLEGGKTTGSCWEKINEIKSLSGSIKLTLENTLRRLKYLSSSIDQQIKRD